MIDSAPSVLVRRPVGMPRPDDFALDAIAMPEPGSGEVLVANRLLAMDPAIRGFLDDRPSYLPPVALGDTMRGMTLGEIVRSRNTALPEASLVRALAGWAEHAILWPDALGLERIEPVAGARLET